MGWGQRWPDRERRPKVRSLTEAEKQDILATLKRGIVASPVLSAFGIQVRVQRGRFYIERQQQDEDSEPDTEVWGRITPLADADNELLLETANRKGKWSEVTQGAADNLIKAIASDTRGKFHGLGFLDASLRKLGKGQDRLPVKHQGKGKYAYADTGKGCTVQETLFHYFGIPIEVVAEPSNWYEYRRTPEIIEASKDRTRVLVQFTAETMSGETFGGTCLYIQREGQWAAYTIKPSDSENIAQAEAWLVKRKWRAW